MLRKLKQLLGLEKNVDQEKRTSLFKERYATFNDLLQCNSNLATIIASMEAVLRGERNADVNQIRKDARQAIIECERMATCLNDISEKNHDDLVEAVKHLGKEIENQLEQHNLGDVKDLTLALADIDASLTYAVGGKSANLGEISNVLGIQVPRGFAITIQAGVLHLLRTSGLFKKIHSILRAVDPEAPQSIHAASTEIQNMIIEAKVPSDVENHLLKRWDLTFGQDDVVCALRSSAIAEDGVQSFAGQYATLLGVRRNKFIAAFKQIIASLFSERALTYRSNHGFRLEAQGMGVLCLEMVSAYAAGVCYSRHPLDLRSNCVLINGVFGLGEMVVDGSGTPDMWLFARTDQVISEKKIACKREKIVLDVTGAECVQKRVPVEQALQNTPCLTDTQVATLGRIALQLERHYQYPQDVEWAINPQGELLILQTRPLRMESAATDLNSPELADLSPIAQGADCAARGVACGKIVAFDPEKGVSDFPEGGVMLLKHSSPLAMVALNKACAVIAEIGSMTGHMAILCREFGVPCIMNLPDIAQQLSPGQLVTVDALAGRIFAGEIPELLSLAIKKEAPKEDTPALMLLKRIAPLILPLHLVDPNSELFQAQNCTSLHDCMRYCHEFSYNAMFQISDDLADGSDHGAALKLACPIPLDLYVIDLGGGLSPTTKRVAHREDITSLPFTELLNGMLDPAVQAKGPRPINMKGFLSVMGQSMIGGNNSVGERFGDHSYAIISDRYLMLSSRVGYHYAVLDTWCGNTLNKNYIRFEFSGGAASNERKERRIRCIGIILSTLGFTVEAEGTRLKARFQKYAKEATQERLVQMGRLLIMTRQLDMLMVNEESVQHFANNFLEGRYH
ncbi:MAG: pyruvate, phosphate dikinase [Desulfovibrionaceae bacterium]|nr:pyruvate, phosphate dikinase [Desulfovibrionaceae bacterium]